MEIEQFTPGIATQVMALWEKHLGRYDTKYFEFPELLVENVSYGIYNMGHFEDRIGSRYTDDSKLIAYIRDGLEFECYAQAHTVWGIERKKEAEKAEEAFNVEIKQYIHTIL